MAPTTSSQKPTFLQLLGADPTENQEYNLNEQGCKMRSDSAWTFLLLAVVFTGVGKMFSSRSNDLSTKFLPWYPISILYCSAVASYVESHLQVCVIVTVLNAAPSEMHLFKTLLVLLSSILTHIFTFVILGMNEKGRWCPLCSTSTTSSVWCYIPNLIGYVRLLLLFAGIFFLQAAPWVFVTCWSTSCILDFFDGYYARKFNQCSRFGILLDIICDNTARSMMWIAAALVNPTLFPVASTVVILEWVTFVCTQLAANNKQQHWKKLEIENKKTTLTTKTEQLPSFVVYFFSNNFLNPLGMLGIGGLFGCPFLLYVRGAELWAFTTEWNVLLYVIICGRVLSAVIEIYFCSCYLTNVVNDEIAEKKKIV